MSGRWFRMYDELLDDPKVQRLAPETFKAWVNILCMASRNDGRLGDIEHIAFALRMDEKKAEKIIVELQKRGLLDAMDGGFEPHAWNARQYKSDVSTERVKQHRERKRNVSSTVTRNVSNDVSQSVSPTVSETPPDTETETETEKTPLPPPQPTAADQAGQARRWDHGSMDALHRRLVEGGNIGTAPVANDFNGLGPIIGLIDAGYDVDLDVLPAIRKAMESPENRPKQWKFFVGWIETARRERLKITQRGAASIAQEPAVETYRQKQERIWGQQLAALQRTGRWSDQWGAEPGNPSCPIPPEFVAKWRSKHQEAA